MSEEKFVGYFRLLEACQGPGCPVCRCVVVESRRYLDALLYEQVTDPDTRRVLRTAWGFCNWHTWMLLEVDAALLGTAIIYEDLVALALRRTEALVGPERTHRWLAALVRRRRRRAMVERYRSRAMCPACLSASAAEWRYLEALVTFVDDGDLQAAYARSDGLCLPHLLEIADGDDAARARTLIERTRERWRRLAQDIGSFVSKHDYRNREPYTEAEADSYRRAFEMLVGASGLFGNDVGPRPSARAPRAADTPRET
jgi:hypothetical protein